MKTCRMTHKDFHALVKYMEAHRESILAERPHREILAERAAAEFGFRCTRNNIKAAAKLCAMEWTAVRSNVGKHLAPRVSVARVLAEELI